MGKRKGAIAAKARARRDARNCSARSPSPECAAAEGIAGPIVSSDGQRVHRGLQNLGNTCFLNSIVQCLNVSLPFSDELMGLLSQGLEGIPRTLCTAFRGIRGVEAAQPAKGAFNPKPLREELISKFPWYSGKQQHDAHELLRTLLGSISDETTKTERAQAKEAGGKPVAEGSGCCGECVSNSFRGHICAATLCWGCGKVSLRLDPFLDLSLDLPALAGQAVGALGVTAAIAQGEPLAPPRGAAAAEEEEAGESADERVGGKAERRERRRRGKVRTEAAAPKPRPGPKGVWASRSEAEELRESTRKLVARIVVRALQSELVTVAGEEEEEGKEADKAAEEEAVFAEIELTRQSRKLQPNWGFKWSEAQLEEGSFVLTGIKEDSVLEKWNLKCRAIGDDELIICVGDRLLEVNGLADVSEMRKTLRHEDRVELKFQRGRGAKASELGAGREDSDQEAERKAEARERLRVAFCDTATQCHEALPEPLREIFGPEKATQESGSHLVLEDCLRRFSVVEALEDELKPVYHCAVCSKEEKVKTYASRRMWLWQADLPPLLTLQLKRFRRYHQRFEKSAASIALPTVLDVGDFVLAEAALHGLRPFVAPGADLLERLAPAAEAVSGEGAAGGSRPGLRYELYGICEHQGSSMCSGHYVAYVNGGASLEREAWFGISDAKVWSCKRAEVLKAQAYIAFYRREGIGEAHTIVQAAEETKASPDHKEGSSPEDGADEADEEAGGEEADGD